MSYDIRFAVKVAGTEKEIYAVIGHPESDSPTYNVGKIFRKAMDWDFTQGEFYKLSEVIPKIERGIHELLYNNMMYWYMEPDNGWGNCGTVLETLQSIMRWITEELPYSWNRDVPLECLYIAW